MEKTFPAAAQVVIIGGGIAGCSVAYHLAKLGVRDIVLVEQGQLTCGTTWHAAGLVGQLRANRNMTQMSRYGVELYARLEAETGQATGWRQCGSITVARTAERMILLRRMLATAASFGVEAELIDPKEAGRRWPLMRTDDLAGAVWLPGDGKANPTDLTQALAKGARQGGVRIFEKTRVTGLRRDKGQVTGVETNRGTIACAAVANCAGQWARGLGLLAGVNVPLHSAEHFYIVTKPIAGITPDLPVMRDPDGYTYFKEEVGGLVMGGFEPAAKPWGMDGIPDGFEFQLLNEDWDQFEILMTNAIARVPALETAEVRQLLNGPESFTLDGNFILGEAPELRGFYVAAGFNSAGIANAGGAGRLLAEWIAGNEPPMDLLDVDIRRFAGFHANRAHLRDRTVETLGLHYAMRWPRLELASVRPLRCSPLYDRLKAKGAQFGSKIGWERPNWFATAAVSVSPPTFGRPTWLDPCIEEQCAAREAVAVFDQTSFAKFLLQGRDAEAVLQRLCANDIAVPPGRTVYTAMLNRRGGFESDITIQRLAHDRFFIVSATAQAARDADWVTRHIGAHEAALVDVTSGWTVLSVMGPRARELLTRLSKDDLTPAAFPFAAVREIDVGYARVRAARLSYIGGPGFELYIPSEFATGVYDALFAAGGELGLRDAGYYALDALRIEAGRRAFGAELGPDETPYQAGLETFVRPGKGVDFIGRAALAKPPASGPAKRLALFVLDDPAAFLWGGEAILRDGAPVGEVTSAGYSGGLGRAVAMGYVRGQAPLTDGDILAGHYEIDAAGTRHAARVQLRPPFPARPSMA